MPFTSILYANGPGYVHVNGTRGNITMVDYCESRLMVFRCSCLSLLICVQPVLTDVVMADSCLSLSEKQRWNIMHSFHCDLFSFFRITLCIYITELLNYICMSLWHVEKNENTHAFLVIAQNTFYSPKFCSPFLNGPVLLFGTRFHV